MTTNREKSSCSGEILVAKFHYQAQEARELSMEKNERLILLDDSCLWWKVKRIDSDQIGFIPSNFARREKRSFLEKIISKRLTKKTHEHPSMDNERVISSALVKFRYEAESADELSLNKAIAVNVLQKKNDGWWLIECDGRRGWFPSNYLIEKTSENFSLIHQICHEEEEEEEDRSQSSGNEENRLDPVQRHSAAFTNEKFYFGPMTRDEAEKLLKIYAEERGDFLLRDSERRFGQYSLSIFAEDGTIRHFRIDYSDDDRRFHIGKRSFDTFDDLLDHYHRHPIFDADPTEKLYLRNAIVVRSPIRRAP